MKANQLVLWFLLLASGLVLIPIFAEETDPDQVSTDRTRLTVGQIEKLIEQLGDDDWQIREEATQKLINLGEPVLEAVKQALKHPDPEVKLRARFIFKHLRWGISPELRARIGNLVDDYEESNRKVRLEIIRNLAAYKELAALVLCRLLVYEEDPDLYPQFFNSLWSYLDNPQITARAREILGESDENTSLWVRCLLGRIAEKEKKFSRAIKHYETALQDKPGFSSIPSFVPFIRKRLVLLYQITETKEGVPACLAYYLKQNDILMERPERPDTPALHDEYIILLWFGMNDPAALESWTEQVNPIIGTEVDSRAVAQKRFMLLARLAQSQGQYQQAIRALELALEAKMRDTEVFHYLIDLCLQANELTKALEVCEQLKKKDPGDIRAYYFSAMAHQKQGDEAAVTECLAKVRELTKDESGGEEKGTHYKLGEFLEERGQLDWARIEFETVLSKTPHQAIDDANAAEHLALIAFNEEDYETTLNYAEQGRPVVMSNRTRLLENFDTFFSEALFFIPPNRKADYFNSNLEYVKAKAAHKKGEAEKGNEYLMKALEIYPGNVAVLEEMAELGRQDKFPEDKLNKFAKIIVKHYQDKIEQAPNWSVYYCHLANVYLSLEKELDRSFELIKEALLIDPSVLAYQITLAQVYAKQKRYAKARAIMELVINLKPYEKEFKELLDEFTQETDKEIKPQEKDNESKR